VKQNKKIKAKKGGRGAKMGGVARIKKKFGWVSIATMMRFVQTKEGVSSQIGDHDPDFAGFSPAHQEV